MIASTEAASPPEQAARKDQRYWWLLSAGALSVLVSLVIGTTKYSGSAPGHWTLSHANGVCASPLGQFAQVLHPQLVARCASIASLEQWRGWLMVAGIAVIAAGTAWGLIANRSR
jgi:hypothetical protein